MSANEFESVTAPHDWDAMYIKSFAEFDWQLLVFYNVTRLGPGEAEHIQIQRLAIKNFENREETQIDVSMLTLVELQDLEQEIVLSREAT